MGDFNDIIGQEEKLGGRKVTRKSHVFLKNFMADMRALDLGFSSSLYTWCNKKVGECKYKGED